MDSEKFMRENFSQDNACEFADILKNAISSYIDNQNSCTVNEWLNNYLSEQLSDKSKEEISNITNTIVNTVVLHNETIVSMHDAIESGKSIETWFQKETVSSENSAGQQAYNLVEVHEALTTVSNQYSEPDEQQEVVDIEVISPEEWEDRNWNKYRMKDLVSETVQQAGEVALKTTASDLYKLISLSFVLVLTPFTPASTPPCPASITITFSPECALAAETAPAQIPITAATVKITAIIIKTDFLAINNFTVYST